MVPEPSDRDFRRLNKNGHPFKKGDIREDGFIFATYVKTKKTKDGFYKEKWLSPKAYQKQLDDQKTISKEWRKNRAKERRELIDSLKLEKGCSMCGYKDHAVALDFDHLNPEEKNFTIATKYLNIHIERLLKEIDKCQVLCANCHRVKTLRWLRNKK